MLHKLFIQHTYQALCLQASWALWRRDFPKNSPARALTVYRARANKAKAQLNKARAQALKAERDLNRIRPLYEQNAASQLDLDNAIAS